MFRFAFRFSALLDDKFEVAYRDGRLVTSQQSDADDSEQESEGDVEQTEGDADDVDDASSDEADAQSDDEDDDEDASDESDDGSDVMSDADDSESDSESQQDSKVEKTKTGKAPSAQVRVFQYVFVGLAQCNVTGALFFCRLSVLQWNQQQKSCHTRFQVSGRCLAISCCFM